MTTKKMTNKKIKTILVALDYSAFSKKVFEQAIVLSHSLKTPLTAIHIAPDPMHQSRAKGEEGLNIDMIREKFEKYYDLKRKKIKSIVAVGLPARIILDQAAQMESPMVVIGYKGRSAITRFMLGSVAEQVMKNATCPLWIHRGAKVVKPTRILVPHDLRATSDIALDTASQLNGGKSQNIEAYYVWEVPEPVLYYDGWIANYTDFLDIADASVREFKKTHPKFKVVKTEGYPVARILDREKKFDVVVLHPHAHSELFHPEGHITGKVVRSSRGPIVVVP